MVQYSLGDIVGVYCCQGDCGGRGCDDVFGLVSVYLGKVYDVRAFIGVKLWWWELLLVWEYFLAVSCILGVGD